MTMFLYRVLNRMGTIVFVLKAILLTWKDVMQLSRVYPQKWRDARFRYALGLAMERAGKAVGDGDMVEAGQVLTSGEVPPEVFDE